MHEQVMICGDNESLLRTQRLVLERHVCALRYPEGKPFAMFEWMRVAG
jgi:hypothetical protein